MEKARLLLPREIKTATEILRAGGIVAVSTETVWGLCANLQSGDKLFAAKNRPRDKSLVMQFATLHAAKKYFGAALGEDEIKLFKKYRGKITVVLKNNIAVRIPDDKNMRKFLKLTQPVYVTSANISGQPAATNWETVFETLGNKIDAIIKSAPCAIGLPSTIVKIVDGTLTVLREGAARI